MGPNGPIVQTTPDRSRLLEPMFPQLRTQMRAFDQVRLWGTISPYKRAAGGSIPVAPTSKNVPAVISYPRDDARVFEMTLSGSSSSVSPSPRNAQTLRFEVSARPRLAKY